MSDIKLIDKGLSDGCGWHSEEKHSNGEVGDRGCYYYKWLFPFEGILRVAFFVEYKDGLMLIYDMFYQTAVQTFDLSDPELVEDLKVYLNIRKRSMVHDIKLKEERVARLIDYSKKRFGSSE